LMVGLVLPIIKLLLFFWVSNVFFCGGYRVLFIARFHSGRIRFLLRHHLADQDFFNDYHIKLTSFSSGFYWF